MELVNFAGQDDKTNKKKYAINNISGAKSQDKKGLQTLADLEGLVDDGLTVKFLHSFYYYTGSLSQPGCNENIKRIVMLNPIEVFTETYNNIKLKVLDGFNIQVNSRRAVNIGQNSMKGYQVYKHIDTTDKQKCTSSKILEKYVDPAYKEKLSAGEYKDYQALLLAAQENQKRYSSTLKNLQRDEKSQTDSLSVKTDV